MPADVLMPALSPTMTEGKLARWLVKEGDAIKSGMVLAEIETDKATMEVEAVDEGTLGAIYIAGGTENVAVNTPIAVILRAGETMASVAQPTSAPAAANSAAPVVASALAAAAPAAPVVAPVAGQGRIFASPLARRIAQQKNIDLAQVKGTGAGGRIVQADVEGYVPAAAPAAKPAAAPVSAPAPTADTTHIPLDGMRKTVAKRLTEAKQQVPHFYLSMDVQLDALMALRTRINKAAPTEGAAAYKISVNDFVIKAMAMALRQVPSANVTWGESVIIQHHTVDVSVAVAVEGGLFTPVIRRADEKSLSTISREMKDLAARARSRKLKPEEYAGGVASVSNLGMFGVKSFSAIINPPQSSILAVGAGEKRVIVAPDGTFSAAEVMSLTLSVDHRAVDGALGAQLLGRIKALLEEPLGLLV